MASPGGLNEQREALEKEATTAGLLMIPEYQFDHAIYMITEKNLSEEGLSFGYNKCLGFLQLRSRQEVGITVIVSPKWMFVGLLTNPYTTNSNGSPVFLDGFCFSGLVSLQTVEKTWPATAGLENDQLTIMEAINKSTAYVPTPVEEVDDNVSDGGVERG